MLCGITPEITVKNGTGFHHYPPVESGEPYQKMAWCGKNALQKKQAQVWLKILKVSVSNNMI